eukprot:scaffold3857_cov127-Cylindrotheca_fusiformis.AAC.12
MESVITSHPEGLGMAIARYETAGVKNFFFFGLPRSIDSMFGCFHEWDAIRHAYVFSRTMIGHRSLTCERLLPTHANTSQTHAAGFGALGE